MLQPQMEQPTDYIGPLILLATAHLGGAMSPGPAFIFVARTAASKSRRAGMIAAFAMAVGAGIWGVATMVGLAEIFDRVQWLYLVAKWSGAVFLVYVSYMIWRHAAAPIANEPETANASHGNKDVFRTGLWLQLSNPKVAIFFGAIFITILPQNLPYWFRALVLAIVFVNEFVWYAFVAFVLSNAHAKKHYLKWKVWLDRATALFLFAMALRLVLTN